MARDPTPLVDTERLIQVASITYRVPDRQTGCLTPLWYGVRHSSRLLSWPYIREDEPAPGEPPEAGYALICPPEGVVEPALNFDHQVGHRRPVWPTVAGEQIPTMHLDVTVDDLDVAVAWAVECGAVVAELQPRPTEHRVVIDPEGNPICLCLA